jgi:predicted nuclease of predicted toxin-antitoxin system
MGARRKKSKKPSGTKAEQLLEQTTFFVDFCLGRHVGEALRAAGLKVEFHLDHFAEDAEDEEWLPVVGERNWVVLTKDKGIRRKSWEREKVISAKVRLFTLPSGNMTGEEMAKMYLANRFRMARFLRKHPPPFIAVVRRDMIDLREPRSSPADPVIDESNPK